MNAVLLENVIRLGTGMAEHPLICPGQEVGDNWGLPSPTQWQHRSQKHFTLLYQTAEF